MTVELEDRLRRAFAHRAEHTLVDASSVPARSPAPTPDAALIDLDRARRVGGADRGPLGRRLVLVGAAAAVVAGVVVLAQRIEPTVDEAALPASVPAQPAGSRFALSLDHRRGLPTDESAVPADRYVIDPVSVPAGWSIEESGMSFLDSSGTRDGGSFYRYDASVIGPGGAEVRFSMTRTLGEPAVSGDTVGSIDGFQAHRPGGPDTRVSWQPEPGMTATVQGAGSVDDLVAFADSLEYRRVGTFPAPSPRVQGDEGRPTNQANVQFAGAISDRSWAVEVEPGPLRTMWASIDGQRTGGFENDRLSQPTDTPVTGVSNSLDATPGIGVAVYGYGPAALTSVVATLADGSTVSFPTYQRELEAFFAVPIPVGVRVISLSYLAGDDVHSVFEVPDLPSDLGGGYGLFDAARVP